MIVDEDLAECQRVGVGVVKRSMVRHIRWGAGRVSRRRRSNFSVM